MTKERKSNVNKREEMNIIRVILIFLAFSFSTAESGVSSGTSYVFSRPNIRTILPLCERKEIIGNLLKIRVAEEHLLLNITSL